MTAGAGEGVRVELFTSAFCAPCRAARSVVDRAATLVPSVVFTEVDVGGDPARAERAGITSTPTVLVHRDGERVLHAAGVPTLPQLLHALDAATRGTPGGGDPLPG